MDTERLGKSFFFNWMLKYAGRAMESPLRKWLMDPVKLLEGSDLKLGQKVLEVGCGTGFFTVEAAKMIGPTGHLIAMDPLEGFVERVKAKVQSENLDNVEVIRRDALNTKLEDSSVDVVLLYGVVPYPTLPLGKLLPEMHRILKDRGLLALWLFPTTAFVPTYVRGSALFTELDKKNGIYRFVKR